MRALTLLLILSVATATTAGCFGKEDDPPATSPTPGGTTPPTGATPSGTPSTSPTPGGTNTTPTPTKPAPREVFSGTASFAPSPAPDPANPTGVLGAPVNNPFTVPAGYTTLTLNVTWANAAPAAVVSELDVSILDAAGAPLASCTVAQGAVQGAPPLCTMTATIPATGGDFVAQYSGSAPPSTVTAAVSIVAS